MAHAHIPVSYTHLDVYKRQAIGSVVRLVVGDGIVIRKIEAVCVCGEMCLNNACDLNCVCSFRMSFLFVFVGLYISNCSRVSSFRPFVCTCRMFMLLSMFLYVWFASMRWFAKVDSVVVLSLIHI